MVDVTTSTRVERPVVETTDTWSPVREGATTMTLRDRGTPAGFC